MSRITDDSIDLRRYVAAIKRYKWLYAVTLAVMMAGSLCFAFTREPQYELYAKLMVEHSDGSSMVAGMSQLTRLFSLGGVSGGMSVDNELYVMQSRQVLEKTVKDLNLNQRCLLAKGFMHKQTLYGDSPLLVVTDNHYYDTLTKPMQFKVSLKESGKADIKVPDGFFSTIYEAADVDLPATVELNGVQFTIMPTEHYVRGEEMKMNLWLLGTKDVVDQLSEDIGFYLVGLTSDVVVLSYKSPHLQLGKDVLNTIMANYNERRLADKDKKACHGVEYVDEQLEAIYADLVASDKRLEAFKDEHNITDITAEMGVLLQSSSTLNEQMLQAKSQMLMCDLMLKYLNSDDTKYSLVPATENGGDATAAVVSQYNELVMQRIRLLRSAKPDNLALAETTAQIDAMRGGVIESVEQQKRNCNAAMQTLQEQYDKLASRLGSAPHIERQYMEIMRENTMQNELYLLLLGKKADYRINISALSVPGFVIDEAYAPEDPSYSLLFPLVCLVLSLLLPTLWALLMMWRRNVVEHEYDIPMAIRHSENFAVCEGNATLRSAILNEESKTVPLLYGPDTQGAAIVDLCRKVGDTGRRVLLVDLGNITGCGSLWRSGDDFAPVAINEGVECEACQGDAGDVLLNLQLSTQLQAAGDRYDHIVVAARYSEDVLISMRHLSRGKTMFYLLVAGVTKRSEVTGVAKRTQDTPVAFGIV